MRKVVLLLALVAAACGGAEAEPPAEVASLSESESDATTTTEPGGEAADTEEALLAYVRCMRSHGIDMPDPQLGDGGGFVVFESGADDASRAQHDAAHAACEDELPAAGTEAQPADPAELAAAQEQLLAFARCMRANGIDMPDPQLDASGGTSYQFRMGDHSAAEIERIQQACSDEAGMAGPAVVQAP